MALTVPAAHATPVRTPTERLDALQVAVETALEDRVLRPAWLARRRARRVRRQSRVRLAWVDYRLRVAAQRLSDAVAL